jgi:choline monooxygenase
MTAEIEHPCNWKIPIENVLETYHVPHLHRSFVARHPKLLRVFGDDGEHELGSDFTEYRDRMGATFAPYRMLVRTAVGHTKCEYRHHHAFPSLIIGETPILSFLQVVTPCGPTRSRSIVRLYLHHGVPVRRVVGQLAAWFLASVLREDAAIYESVQSGVAAADRTGVLSAREERVWAMQRWLAARVTNP